MVTRSCPRLSAILNAPRRKFSKSGVVACSVRAYDKLNQSSTPMNESKNVGHLLSETRPKPPQLLRRFPETRQGLPSRSLTVTSSGVNRVGDRRCQLARCKFHRYSEVLKVPLNLPRCLEQASKHGDVLTAFRQLRELFVEGLVLKLRTQICFLAKYSEVYSSELADVSGEDLQVMSGSQTFVSRLRPRIEHAVHFDKKLSRKINIWPRGKG